MSQRAAICTAFGWDYSDLVEYQPTRRMHSKTFLYQVNNGYVIATPFGAAIPRVYREFATWRKVGTFSVRNRSATRDDRVEYNVWESC